jgi:hypothetical protein
MVIVFLILIKKNYLYYLFLHNYLIIIIFFYIYYINFLEFSLFKLVLVENILCFYFFIFITIINLMNYLQILQNNFQIKYCNNQFYFSNQYLINILIIN